VNKMEEYNKEICIREINENIKRVFNDEPLTRPLRVLRNNCEFKKRYDLAFDLKYNVRKCLNCRKEFKDINEEGCCSTNCKKEYRKNHPKKKILTEQEKKDKIAEKGKEYRENNKDKIAEKGKEYRENNKDKIKEYYENNKDKIKEYYENNKDKIKEYYENNKDKIAEKGKEYRENNKDKIAERRKKRYVEKKFALVSDEENNEH